ncbi:unnamed protein product [Schistosoma mattheei]|uniref:Uncharacterized protein n=1 Tax=Schistosoma mattheei TaxID=31246 RepID=A0A183Q759_9TREM|nr:unnamed protein product [Schistosoma mattheei]
MEDVRTRRGADTASDHHLVVANLGLKLKKNWTTGQTTLQRFNTAFLRDIQNKRIKDSPQQQVPSLTRQLERYQTSINLNVSRGPGSKEAPS